MIYFLSDTHFGNNKPVGYCQRPSEDNVELDQMVIDNINNCVKKTDTLYFLGDFCHKGKNPKKYREQINCDNIHLILGNHDTEEYCKKYFSSVSLLSELIHNKQRIILCHYPMRAWHKSYRNSWMLYGHVHGRLQHEDMTSSKHTLDVGVDNTKNHNKDFGSPWSFNEINSLFNKKHKHILKNSRSI